MASQSRIFSSCVRRRLPYRCLQRPAFACFGVEARLKTNQQDHTLAHGKLRANKDALGRHARSRGPTKREGRCRTVSFAKALWTCVSRSPMVPPERIEPPNSPTTSRRVCAWGDNVAAFSSLLFPSLSPSPSSSPLLSLCESNVSYECVCVRSSATLRSSSVTMLCASLSISCSRPRKKFCDHTSGHTRVSIPLHTRADVYTQ